MSRMAVREDGTPRFGRTSLAVAGVIGLLAAVLLALGAAELPRQQREASDGVEHTLQVLARAATLDADLATVVSEGRGFLVDRTADSARRFEDVSRQVASDLAVLRALTTDNPAQQAVLNRLDPLVMQRISVLREIIERLQAGDENGGMSLARTQRGRLLMDQIRDTVEVIKAEESRLLGAREQTARNAARRMVAGLTACSALVAASGLLIVVLLLSRGRERAHLAALHGSEARFRALFEQSPLLIHVFDPTGQTIAVNPAVERAFGVPAQELRAYNVLQDPQPHQNGTRGLLERTFAGEVTRSPPARHEAAAALGMSEATWIEMTGYPVKDAAGRVREVVLLSHDVTERMEAQESARESQVRLHETNKDLERRAEEFRTLADNIPTLCWMANADGHIRWYNRRWYEYTGTDPENQAGWGWESVHDPEVLPSVAARWRHSLATGKAFEMTFPLLGVDGVFRPFLTRVVPIRDDNGEIVRWFGTNTDVTEQHAAEQALARHRDELERIVAERTAELAASEARLRESEAGFRLLAENASDMVVRVGPDGTRLYASPASMRVVGWAPEDLVGRHPQEIVHPDDLPVMAAFQARLLAGGVEADIISLRVLHSEYGEIWIEVGARSLHDLETGVPDGYVAAVRDVTARHQIEVEREARTRELATANAELERLARHLGKARDQAETASQAKSRFLAGMSHELRTPLNGILGYTQLLHMEGSLDTRQQMRVDCMLEAGQHLLQMINRVLDLSAIEADSIELEIADVDLLHLARGCLDFVRPTADAKGLALKLTVAPGAPSRVMSDPARLRQVLLNLLGNAVKFTTTGTVELRVLAARGARLRIEVADTGPGIPPDRSHLLFQEFERLDAGAGQTEGAGLGLAISVRLSALMGGHLGHADNQGGGSVFWLELPTTVILNTPVAATASEPVAQPMPLLRILVVDDILMNRDIASSFLSAAGHAVTCVENGAAAVEQATMEDYDVILMDVRMPGMDGLEASRRIRMIEGGREQVPIVALTAQAFAEQVKECRQAGMDSHLAKPFAPAALLAIVARVTLQGKLRHEVSPHGVTEAVATPDLPVCNATMFESVARCVTADALARHMAEITARSEDFLRQLHEPHQAGANPLDLVEAAHTLAGSAGMFGYQRLAFHALRYEQAVMTAASSDLPTIVESLGAALEASLKEMRCRVPAVATYGG